MTQIAAAESDADLITILREKTRPPVSRLQELRWAVSDIESFFGNDEPEPAHPRYATAAEAVEGIQLAEHLRRMADVIAVQTVDDVVESRVIDEHGHSSAKAMYDAATKQSGRDLYALEQVRNMFRRCDDIKTAATEGDLSWDHLRLLARVYANRRVRAEFIDQQGWFLLKAARFDFRRFEILVNRWEEIHDEDGPEPDDAHQRRSASAVQDHFSKTWHRRSQHGPQIGAAMAEIEQIYFDAEFAKDWEAAKEIHGDAVCKDVLARTDTQRRADAQAQIYADAAANPKSSVPFNFVHNIVWSQDTYLEMLRRYCGSKPTPFDVDTMRCETIDGKPLDANEAFIDSLSSAFRRVVVDAASVTIDMSEQRFFTGLSRVALQISHDECEWIGCHVPGSRCQADHVTQKSKGGPTEQWNGAILCQRHNRHKERGYTVWRDPTTGQLRMKTPQGAEITSAWD